MMHLTVCVQLIFQVLCTRRDCLSGILRLASIGWQCSRATLESERGERPKRRGSAGGNFIKARDVMSAKLSKQKPIAEFDFGSPGSLAWQSFVIMAAIGELHHLIFGLPEKSSVT
mmetsp:Transcript_93892/g.176489  ORF Transcript_93892/g.176489 Transcript_93892/m.176489 type:complete len:115 (-) Transcript_93892:12-356(-)